MIHRIFFVVSVLCFAFLLYGLVPILTPPKPEENECKMTYMYSYPQYVRIPFEGNEEFPKYGLYAYTEGINVESTRNMTFKGAPVIFIPGNSGSYKQGRSLASVALQRAAKSRYGTSVDFFTIDYNEEFSALFGGVLEEQVNFLEIAIKKVLSLYKRYRQDLYPQVVLIGHSMGGKIAQAVACRPGMSYKVNTIITLSTPMDRPVINLDFHLHGFYEKINTCWSEKRHIERVYRNATPQIMDREEVVLFENTAKILPSERLPKRRLLNAKPLPLDHILLISIGGGPKDILVPSRLTESKFSDIHIISTNIPKVWASTDHLCAVWCLEQVKVITKFLFEIVDKEVIDMIFVEKKSKRMRKAVKHFMVDYLWFRRSSERKPVKEVEDMVEWYEDSRRVFQAETNKNLWGRIIMIRLLDNDLHKRLYVQAIGKEPDYEPWVFACNAKEIRGNSRYCSKGILLDNMVELIPSKRRPRMTVDIDLHKLHKDMPENTHVLLYLLRHSKQELHIDIHDPDRRKIVIDMPKWYSFEPRTLLSETEKNISTLSIEVRDIEEVYQSMELDITPVECRHPSYHTLAKIKLPWAEGYDRYQYFTENITKPMIITTPVRKPRDFNTTTHPFTIQLTLDSVCTYKISVRNSVMHTMKEIIRNYSIWLPSHIVAIILLAFKHQISITPPQKPLKIASWHSALLKCTPIFIVTATRIFVKLPLWQPSLPQPDDILHSMFPSVFIHCTAFMLVIISTVLLWAVLISTGNIAHKILCKLIHLPVWPISTYIVPIMEKMPITIAIFLISMAITTCGGIALICACIAYCILLSKMYENYLEEYVYDTAKMIAQKIFGRKSSVTTNEDAPDSTELANENIDTLTNDNEVTSNYLKSDKEIESLDINEMSSSTKDCEIKTTTKINALDNVKMDESFELLENPGSATDKVSPTEHRGTQGESEEQTIEKLDVIEEEKINAELQKLLEETMERKRKAQKLSEQDEEYETAKDELSAINFHIPLLFLLITLTFLNIPSVITWGRNYSFNPTLSPDPSLFPAIVTISSLGIIWQLNVPRDVSSYRVISVITYVLAALCIMYCQDSVYRLNGIICTIFLFICVHQLLTPLRSASMSTDNNSDVTIEQLEKFKQLLNVGGDDVKEDEATKKQN